MKLKESRIGMGNINNNSGSNMKIIEYIDSNNIYVEFDNKYIAKTSFHDFKKGKVRNVFDKTFENVGYIGVGKYKLTINRNLTNAGNAWSSMLTRCYNEVILEKCPTYIGCSVCDEWHNFQNFAKWHEENYYKIEGEKIDLDKDILVKGNKIYSPETCIFVPHSINMMFLKRNRNNLLEEGVKLIKRPKPYVARYNEIHIGSYYTEKEAFVAYKLYKENHFKQIADKYKYNIPKKLYDKLYTYSV